MTLGLLIAFGTLFINYNMLNEELQQTQFTYADPTIYNELVVDNIEVYEIPEIETYYEHKYSVPMFPNGDPYDR